MMDILEQNTTIEYDIVGLKGIGKIKGYSAILPVTGIMYIVENIDELYIPVEVDNETYPFTCFICPECYITSIVNI